MKPAYAFSIALSLAMSFDTPTRAEPAAVPQEAVRQARDHFERALELYETGSLDAAAAEFGRAYDLVPNVKVLFNLAQLRAAQRDYVLATRLYERFLRDAGDEVASVQLEYAQQQISAFQQYVARLWVGESEQAGELLVDGRVEAALPLTTPVVVSAGVHAVELRRPGLPTFAEVVRLSGGETLRLELPRTKPTVEVDATGTTPVVAVQTGNGSSGLGAPFWIATVSTAVAASGAVTFGVLAHEARHTLDKQLSRIPVDRAEISGTHTELQRNALLSDAFTITAVVAAAITLYLALSGSDADAPTAREGTAAGAQVIPNGGRVQLLHSF